MFPSPCGVNIVAKKRAKILPKKRSVVSVPLRGKYRGEGYERYGFKLRTDYVSVPLRGKYRGEGITKLTAQLRLALVSVPLRGKYRGEGFLS